MRHDLAAIRDELRAHLRDGIIPFWLERAADREHGGYLVSFGGQGEPLSDVSDKYLVSQARLLWCFSALPAASDDATLCQDLARHGADFLLERFEDRQHGGWHWKVDRAGRVVDPGKLVYGQSFALYAFAAHARSTGDERSRAAAERTFDVLHRAAADVARGGYYENLDADWRLAGGGSGAGDRKSLDVHMHLLEAFTELVLLTGSPVHHRRLEEVRKVVLRHMVDPATGAGGNQYDLDFWPLPPIVIDRTWIAERPTDEVTAPTGFLTSYGHNLELAWLLVRADQVLGLPEGTDRDLVRAIADHTLRFGYDHERGGVFREGPPDGPASDRDKEFWQNAEAMVGFLDAYRLVGDERYLDAFVGTWRFASRHLAHPRLGEWRIRTREDGAVVVGDLGGPWKVAYHTGRAALECAHRLDQLLRG